VLVRLARGVPFSSLEALDAGEARKLAEAIKRSVRALAAMLGACFCAIAGLLFVSRVPAVWGAVEVTAFTTSCLLAFVLIRTVAVVRNDVEIADIQAGILLKERASGEAAEFEKNVAAPARKDRWQPEGYGRVIGGERT
ncbi:MAG: hypothetical protein GDA47_02345, partial [Rhodospirillales bacterium]|nr:hypothetical protein [Rhodospirillales bacterium]